MRSAIFRLGLQGAFAFVLLYGSAFATDLELADGRVLKDAKIISQTPRTVTIGHTEGLISVSKTILPPELRTRYPIDESAARESDLRAAQALKKAAELQRNEIERVARVREQREETAAFNEHVATAKIASEATKYELARCEVQTRAEAYFNNEYEPVAHANNVNQAKVTISDLHLIEGWDNRWFVSGRCAVTCFQVVKEYPYYSREQILESARLDNENKIKGQTIDYTPHDVTQYTTQTRDFEAVYSAEGPTPTFELSLR